MSYIKKEVVYFEEEGRKNIEKVIQIVKNEVIKKNNINKVIVFTSDGKSAIRLKKELENNYKVIAVTFPYKKTFKLYNKKDKKPQHLTPETSKKEIKKNIMDQGVTLLQGVLPFEDIILPNIPDTKIQTINHTLNIFGGGMKLCIESVIVATDSGEVEPGEEVIAMSADTALIATGCRKELLLHPKLGMQIKQILCKPINFNITKK